MFLSAQSWKAAAEDSIRTHRMAEVRVTVLDSQGLALPGARIRVQMRKHAFRWGSTVNVDLIAQLRGKGFGFDSDHPYIVHLQNFNSITPDNAGKWNFWESPIRSVYLETMDWLKENGVANRGHTTIWASITRWKAVPSKVVNAGPVIENGVVIKTKNEVVRDIIREHIESQLPILQNKKVYELDLINELINEGDIVRLVMELPPEDRPAEHAQWHKWAKAAAPEVDLVVNEYNLFQSGNNFHERYVDYVQKMIAAGAPVDVVGMQGHFFGKMPNYAELKRRLAEVAVLGLPMSVTEFDMSETGYAEMERVLYAAFSEPLVHGFSMWGAWDGSQWRNNGPMFRDDWSLKPSGRAWLDLVKGKWWTDTTALSSDTQAFITPAFLGDYELLVEYGGRMYRQPFTLDKTGADLTVSLGDESRVLPQVRLKTPGDQTEAFRYEPLELTVVPADSVVQVRYFGDDLLLATRRTAPFSYVFSSPVPGTFSLKAEVTYSDGLLLRTEAVNIRVNDNEFPFIQDIFPPSGSAVLKSDRLDVFITASDPENDPIRATVSTVSGELLGSTDSYPFHLQIKQELTGFRHLKVRVEDDKFGFQEIDYFLNVRTNTAQQTTELSPLDGADDIEETVGTGEIFLTGDLDLGERIVGIRFPLAGLPAGTTIDSAFLQFTSEKNAQEGETLINWHAELEADPQPFAGSAGNLSPRQLSLSQVPWMPPAWDTIGANGPAQRTPDLGALINELVNLPDWSDQRPIHLIGQVENGPSKRSAYSYDQLPEAAPRLRIHFTPEGQFSAPPQPAGFTFTRTGEDRGIVSWDFPDPEQVAGYKFFFNGELVPEVLLQPEYELTGLVEDSVYTAAVEAISALSVLSERSAPFPFELSGAVTSTVEAFPNPVGDRLHLRNAVRVELFDLQGRLLLQRTGAGTQSIDTSQLPAGTYLLRLWTAESDFVVRQLLKP